MCPDMPWASQECDHRSIYGLSSSATHSVFIHNLVLAAAKLLKPNPLDDGRRRSPNMFQRDVMAALKGSLFAVTTEFPRGKPITCEVLDATWEHDFNAMPRSEFHVWADLGVLVSGGFWETLHAV